jgi:hypothetical protein
MGEQAVKIGAGTAPLQAQHGDTGEALFHVPVAEVGGPEPGKLGVVLGELVGARGRVRWRRARHPSRRRPGMYPKTARQSSP